MGEASITSNGRRLYSNGRNSSNCETLLKLHRPFPRFLMKWMGWDKKWAMGHKREKKI